MPHPILINRTPFAYEALLLTDEEGVAQFAPCVQATFALRTDARLALLDEQPRVRLAGQWRGDPASSSMVLEPQIAFTKPATDIVLLGHAHAPTPGATEGTVGIRVGPVQKVARVFGDRRIVSRLGRTSVTPTAPFERIPIEHERAFGGWDRHDPDSQMHRREARNPVGVGFRVTPLGADEQALPNFEDPQQLFRSWGDTPPPAGFGFIAPDWQPRLAFAGTYDTTWARARKPLLPHDFDRRFFNAAAPGLIAPGHLRGDEPVAVIGATPRGRVAFALPGLPAPLCLMELRGRKRVPLQTVLDTLVVDMDALQVTLTWRASACVRNGAHDVLSVELHADADAAAQIAVAVG